MKILKYIFLLLLLTAVSLTIFVWSREGKYEIENQIEIPLPKNKVYAFLADLRNWGDFNHDEQLQTYSFKVDRDSLNIGTSTSLIKTIENTNIFETDSLKQKFQWFNHQATSMWRLKYSENTTLVSWKCTGDLDFIEKCKALLGNSLENKIKEIIKVNLQKLKESLLKEYSTYHVDIIGKKEFSELYFLDKTTNLNFSDFIKDPFKNSLRYNEFISENSLELISPVGVQFPFTKINSPSKNITISGWLKDEIYTTPESEIICSSRSNLQYLKVRFSGDYEHLAKAFEEGINFANKNELKIDETANVLVHFSVMYPSESKPSARESILYIPLKSSQISELRLAD